MSSMPRDVTLEGHEPVVQPCEQARRPTCPARARRACGEESRSGRAIAPPPWKTAAPPRPSCRTPSARAARSGLARRPGSGVSSKMIAPSRVTRRARTCRLGSIEEGLVLAGRSLPADALRHRRGKSRRPQGCAAPPARPVRSAMTSIVAPASRSVSGSSAPRPLAMTNRPRPPRCSAIRSGKACISRTPGCTGSLALLAVAQILRHAPRQPARSLGPLAAFRLETPQPLLEIDARYRQAPVRSEERQAGRPHAPVPLRAAETAMAASRGGNASSRICLPRAVSAAAGIERAKLLQQQLSPPARSRPAAGRERQALADRQRPNGRGRAPDRTDRSKGFAAA